MNENGYLTEKDLKFIEALKEDHRINGDKSFFELLFVGISFVDSNRFNGTIGEYNGSYMSSIDWIFSYNESYFIGKYKDWFVFIDNEGISGAIGKEIQNLIGVTLYYYGDISNREDFPIDYMDRTSKDFNVLLKNYEVFCEKMDLKVNFSEDLFQFQNEGFDDKIFE